MHPTTTSVQETVPALRTKVDSLQVLFRLRQCRGSGSLVYLGKKREAAIRAFRIRRQVSHWRYHSSLASFRTSQAVLSVGLGGQTNARAFGDVAEVPWRCVFSEYLQKRMLSPSGVELELPNPN